MATITFLQLTKSATDLSTYTFSSVNFGTASAARYLICAINGRTLDGTSSGSVISSVTIGGVSATINTQVQNSGNIVGIATALVPTGTSGDVVVVFAETMTNADIALYSADGLTSATALDTGTSTASNGTATLDITGGGVGVAIAKNDDGSLTATWTGLTEDYDEADANTNDISGASVALGSADIDRTITCTWSGTPVRPVFATASFGTGFFQQISDTNNDVFDNGSAIDLNGDTELVIGEHPSSATEFTGGFRFTGITIPQGATINEAKIRLVNQVDSTGTPTLAIEGEDTDDSAIFSTHADFVGRTRTSASVSWTPGAQTAATAVDTVDIKTVVQEIVDRGGWASGNDMAFFIKNNGGTNSWILVYDYTGSSANAAKLYISYSLGDAYSISCAVGSFTLTGIDALFNKTLSMIASVGSFVLTGIDATFNMGKGIIASVGSFILTGNPVRFTGTGNWKWRNRTKPSDNWTNNSKPSDTWTNTSL